MRNMNIMYLLLQEGVNLTKLNYIATVKRNFGISERGECQRYNLWLLCYTIEGRSISGENFLIRFPDSKCSFELSRHVSSNYGQPAHHPNDNRANFGTVIAFCLNIDICLWYRSKTEITKRYANIYCKMFRQFVSTIIRYKLQLYNTNEQNV